MARNGRAGYIRHPEKDHEIDQNSIFYKLDKYRCLYIRSLVHFLDIQLKIRLWKRPGMIRHSNIRHRDGKDLRGCIIFQLLFSRTFGNQERGNRRQISIDQYKHQLGC